MWRVRILFLFAGLIIIGVAGMVIDLPASEQYMILIGVKLLVTPAIIEGALRTFAVCRERAGGGRPSLIGVRFIIYGVVLMVLAGSTQIAVAPSVERPAQLVLSAVTLAGAELVARLIRRLVNDAAPVPTASARVS